MGKVIRKAAAVFDITADVRRAHLQGTTRGGKFRDLAAEHLAPVVDMIETVGQQAGAAQTEAEPLLAAVGVAHERTSGAVHKVYDDIRNALGRPRNDPALAILFPGGTSFYVDCLAADQPDRVDLLVSLLSTNPHPNLPPGAAAAAAATLQTEATALRGALMAARGPETRAILMAQVKDAIARRGAMALAAYKRALKAGGFTEAEIHTVIPNHPRPVAKKDAATTAKPAAPATAATPQPPAAAPATGATHA